MNLTNVDDSDCRSRCWQLLLSCESTILCRHISARISPCQKRDRQGDRNQPPLPDGVSLLYASGYPVSVSGNRAVVHPEICSPDKPESCF
jgi:hypothetical protein